MQSVLNEFVEPAWAMCSKRALGISLTLARTRNIAMEIEWMAGSHARSLDCQAGALARSATQGPRLRRCKGLDLIVKQRCRDC